MINRAFSISINSFFLSFLILFLSSDLSSQEKMEVEGIVHSVTGGFKFPDNTIQETAAAKLSGGEVSEQRGKVTVAYSGVNGVANGTTYDALDVSFLGTLDGLNNSVFGDVEILHNITSANLPDFLVEYASYNSLSRVHISFFNSSNVKYASITLRGSVHITEFGQSILPFSTTAFGHLWSMKFRYTEMQITDELGGNCTCWRIQFNDDNCICN